MKGAHRASPSCNRSAPALLRQLAQRITAAITCCRCRARMWILCPLPVAGGRLRPAIFTPRPSRPHHRLSLRGIRLSSTSFPCALIAAFARGSHKIVHGDISQSAYEVSGIRDEGSTAIHHGRPGGRPAGRHRLVGLAILRILPNPPLVRSRYRSKWDDAPGASPADPRHQSGAGAGRRHAESLQVWGHQAELEEATCDNAPVRACAAREKPPWRKCRRCNTSALSLTDETGGP